MWGWRPRVCHCCGQSLPLVDPALMSDIPGSTDPAQRGYQSDTVRRSNKNSFTKDNEIPHHVCLLHWSECTLRKLNVPQTQDSLGTCMLSSNFVWIFIQALFYYIKYTNRKTEKNYSFLCKTFLWPLPSSSFPKIYYCVYFLLKENHVNHVRLIEIHYIIYHTNIYSNESYRWVPDWVLHVFHPWLKDIMSSAKWPYHWVLEANQEPWYYSILSERFTSMGLFHLINNSFERGTVFSV